MNESEARFEIAMNRWFKVISEINQEEPTLKDYFALMGLCDDVKHAFRFFSNARDYHKAQPIEGVTDEILNNILIRTGVFYKTIKPLLEESQFEKHRLKEGYVNE